MGIRFTGRTGLTTGNTNTIVSISMISPGNSAEASGVINGVWNFGLIQEHAADYEVECIFPSINFRSACFEISMARESSFALAPACILATKLA